MTVFLLFQLMRRLCISVAELWDRGLAGNTVPRLPDSIPCLHFTLSAYQSSIATNQQMQSVFPENDLAKQVVRMSVIAILKETVQPIVIRDRHSDASLHESHETRRICPLRAPHIT
jgi:hypothetical protein